ncbi:MAG: Fic family protein [Flavobacteriales bacterium]|nr:Fic family protein [Flavobacteriales bacterium]
MAFSFHILKSDFLEEFLERADLNIMEVFDEIEKADLPTDRFDFYRSVSSVYSSRIEGEEIEFDSFFKHRFLNIEYNSDYTKRADDLYSAYEFIDYAPLNWDNLKKAHSILTKNILPEKYQGTLRNNPMFVINSQERIEYVAAAHSVLEKELKKLFLDIDQLLKTELVLRETFFFASMIHLVFVKIHPFQDGNGRAARLLEKWFLTSKLGKVAASVQLEKNYYIHLTDYYGNIRKLGLEYEALNYGLSLDFLLMTILGLKSQSDNG